MITYITIEQIDNGYDAYETKILLVTTDKEKAIKTMLESESRTSKRDYTRVEAWENDICINDEVRK